MALAVVRLLLTIAAVLPGHAQTSDDPPLFGPDAVASSDDAMSCLRAFEPAEFRACLVDAGASSAAVTAAMSLSDAGSPAILTGYTRLGPVDIAEITIPQAGSGTTYGLSVRGERIVPIDGLLNPMSVGDAASARLRRAHPQAMVMSFGWIAGHRHLGDSGQRFVLSWPLVDGCRACPVVGEAIGYVDFRGGTVVDSGMIGWAPVRGEYPTQSAEIRRRLQSGDALELQAQLNLRGYVAGMMDGVYGDITGRALRQFLTEHCIDGDRFTSEAADLLSDVDFRDTRLVDAPCGPDAPAPVSPLDIGPEPTSPPDAGPDSVGGLTIENSGPDLFNIFLHLMSDFCVGRTDCYYFTQRDAPACEDRCAIEGVEGAYVGRKIATAAARDFLDSSGAQMEMLTQQGVPRGIQGRVDPDDIAHSSAYRVYREGCEAESCDSVLVLLFDESRGFVVNVRGDEDARSHPAEDPLSAISAFRERTHDHKSFGDFVADLNTIREVWNTVEDMRAALALFESSLTPRIAAEAELSRVNQGGLLFIGAHVTTFLVRDMYARAAEDPANAPGILAIVPERVALATIDAAFNISSAVVTGGASALVGQTITTTTNVVDAVIAYLELGQETEQLVDQALRQTATTIQHYRDGDLPGEIALRQFEVTNAISDQLASGWVTWGPSKDAADRLAIIAGLARIKVLEGEPPMPPRNVLGTGDLRDRTVRMRGEYCFSCTAEFNQRYLMFADRVARDFMVRSWEPMASPGLLAGESGADAGEAGLDGPMVAELARIEEFFTSAIGVDSEAVQSWLQEAGFLSGPFAPYGPDGRHAEWVASVEAAFRDALEYARAQGVAYDLSDEDGFYKFVGDLRDHRLAAASGLRDGAHITLDMALDHAVAILLGDPYGQTRDEVLSHIAGARIEREDPCGAEIAWVFDVHVPGASNMGGQSIRGDLFLDARTGRMACAELPFLN